MLQKKVVWHFSGKNFREHTNPIFKSQGILKVKDLVKHQSACFMSNVHPPSQFPLSYLGAKTENKKLHSKSPPLNQLTTIFLPTAFQRYGMTYLLPIRIVNLLAYLKKTSKNTSFQMTSHKKYALCIFSFLFSDYTYIM